jgi:hypothetical protein
MLYDGEGWKVVAAHFGMCEGKLRKLLQYRKHDDPSARIKLSLSKYNALVTQLKTNKPMTRILRETGTSCKTLMNARRESGIRAEGLRP